MFIKYAKKHCELVTMMKTLKCVKNIYLSEKMTHSQLKSSLSTYSILELKDMLQETENCIMNHKYTPQKEQNLILSFMNEIKVKLSK